VGDAVGVALEVALHHLHVQLLFAALYIVVQGGVVQSCRAGDVPQLDRIEAAPREQIVGDV
jgi:hypothetical protein